MDQTNRFEMMWHDDGHSLRLRINKSELEIMEVVCPDANDRKCFHDEFDCVVKYFVNRFGMECNAGMCPASEKLDICWTILGNKRDLDLCQIWFMPKTDELFAAWLIASKGN